MEGLEGDSGPRKVPVGGVADQPREGWWVMTIFREAESPENPIPDGLIGAWN